MILKYKNGDAWGFIDNVRRAASKDVHIEEMVRKYDAEQKKIK